MGDRISGIPAPQLKIRQTDRGIAIAIRLTPKAARDAVDGLGEFSGDSVLKARVRAVPEDSKANIALEALIADWLEVPRSAVAVTQGAKSRIKIVSIDGDAIALSALVAARLAALRSISR
jgi:uncharacterized protein YggU (UPF0235/DUF167 family)